MKPRENFNLNEGTLCHSEQGISLHITEQGISLHITFAFDMPDVQVIFL